MFFQLMMIFLIIYVSGNQLLFLFIILLIIFFLFIEKFSSLFSQIVNHPVDFLYKLGFTISINTDNNLFSHTTLSKEFLLLCKTFSLNLFDILIITLNSLDKIFYFNDEFKKHIINDRIIPAYWKLLNSA